jgi:hypothetical protein
MPVVLVMAAVAILAGVVVIAVGRGGELAIVRSDIPPVRFDLFTPADVAAFRPRLAFFGYSARVTDDALLQIARAVAERDAELSRLRVQLTAVRDQLDDGAEPGPARSPGADQEPAADRGMTNPGPADAWPEAARDEPDPADDWPPAASAGPASDEWPPAGRAGPASDEWPPAGRAGPASDEWPPAGRAGPASDEWPPASRTGPEADAWPLGRHAEAEPDAWPGAAGHEPEPNSWPSVVGHPPEPAEPDEPDLAREQPSGPEPAPAGSSGAPAVTAGPAAPAGAGDEADPVARYWDEDR